MKTAAGDPHEFVEAFERRYLSLTELPRVSTVARFDADDPSHRDRSYLQVGVRTSFPVEVVERWDPGFVAREVVDGIERTELSVVAEAAGEAADVVVRPADVDGVLASLAENDVDHLLVPGDAGLMEGLREADAVDRRRSDGAAVVRPRNGGEFELHLHSGEGVYGFGEGCLGVVQKTGETASPPGFDFFDEADFNYDRRMMVYFGEETRSLEGRRFFDLLYRVVVSRPEVEGEVLEIEM